MRASTSSKTAEFMALFRALESVRRPRRKRLFDDPYANRFLGTRLRLVLALARVPGLGALVPRVIDRGWPGARSSGVARTRLIDEAVAAAIADGIEQVVVLGTGFDCRSLRLPGLDRVRVFEVDHPATLAARERALADLSAPGAGRVAAPIDFDREALADVLAATGFRLEARSLFLWEGVTNYLTEDAVDGVLRFVARAAPGSRLLFTYVHRGALDGSRRFAGMEAIARTLVRAGEPWTFGIEPRELAGLLAERGIELVWDLGADEYRSRYGERGPGYEFYRAALATVPASEARPRPAGHPSSVDFAR